MFTKEKISPKDSLLQAHKESTYEKQQKKRQEKKRSQELDVANKYNVLQKLENQRMKRKAMIQAQFNKFEPDMA